MRFGNFLLYKLLRNQFKKRRLITRFKRTLNFIKQENREIILRIKSIKFKTSKPNCTEQDVFHSLLICFSFAIFLILKKYKLFSTFIFSSFYYSYWNFVNCFPYFLFSFFLIFKNNECLSFLCLHSTYRICITAQIKLEFNLFKIFF